MGLTQQYCEHCGKTHAEWERLESACDKDIVVCGRCGLASRDKRVQVDQ